MRARQRSAREGCIARNALKTKKAEKLPQQEGRNEQIQQAKILGQEADRIIVAAKAQFVFLTGLPQPLFPDLSSRE
jgi:hypothetical protein